MSEPRSADYDASDLCPKCLGLGGWPCDTEMPHYAPVPCTCGAQLVPPYPNDTGEHSTTECPIPPAKTGGER